MPVRLPYLSCLMRHQKALIQISFHPEHFKKYAAYTLLIRTQLILLSGYPCSGKTYRTAQLSSNFQTRILSAAPGSRASRLSVVVVSDHSLGISRGSYALARAEKEARGVLASAIRRALGPDVLVVVDAPNYIKGFRYQMYCEAKAQRTPSCVVRHRHQFPRRAR